MRAVMLEAMKGQEVIWNERKDVLNRARPPVKRGVVHEVRGKSVYIGCEGQKAWKFIQDMVNIRPVGEAQTAS